ncbi:MAG: serine/threonine protein phosphatase [Xanthomonadales bacterium]|nr:serine/threonine protein phosphatase [Xanthomonadales bacterium]
MVTKLQIDGQVAWLKRYEGGSRRLRLGLLDWCARRLGLAPLRPPPHRVGPAARDTEQRRIDELASQGARVPRVLGAGRDCLLLADIGPTLAALLRQADPDGADRLVADAAAAVARVHAAGGYLGQPLSRNIAIGPAGEVGFLDFEEDPAEVMPLAHAQARDWLVLAAGLGRHARQDAQTQAALLRPMLASGTAEVRGLLADSVARLRPVEFTADLLGRRASALSRAVRALRAALVLWLPVALGILLLLGLDLAGDGELDLLPLLGGLLL